MMMLASTRSFWSFLAVLLSLACCARAFVVLPATSMTGSCVPHATALDEVETADGKSIIVISPPGGAGEAAAVQAAAAGHDVRWFLVRDDDETVSIPRSVADSWKGSLSLAGGRVGDLLEDEPARDAVRSWAASAKRVDAIIAAYDWENVSSASTKKSYERKANLDSDVKVDVIQANLESAVRVVVRETMKAVGSGSSNGIVKVALLPENIEIEDEGDAQEEEGGGIFGSLFGGKGKASAPPPTLGQAFGGAVRSVRFGELFGLPASSPDFSPIVGGPRRDATITDELLLQGIRVDPYVPGSRRSETICSRPMAGLAAALWATGGVGSSESLSSVLLSSQSDTFPQPLEAWREEWARAASEANKVDSSSPIVFEQLNLQIPDTKRLADWLATKWAPAVLRTYDLAAIRIGARPVYAYKDSETDSAILVWQQLAEDMSTETIAKLRLTVTEQGVTATRESSKRKALPGEPILVRRLQEGLVQAVDKGLAKRTKRVKQTPAVTKKGLELVVAAPKPVTSVREAGTVSSTDGPRTAGARRSTQRKRRSTSKEN